MISCRGCAHYVGGDVPTCRAFDYEQLPRFRMGPDGSEMCYDPRPTVLLMRAANGRCGPDATLYQLSWWRRWLHLGPIELQ